MQEIKKATFGAGCFWCIDAAFRRVKGVHKVESGYCGGHVEHPTYHQVCAGDTGHAEVVELTYDEFEVDFNVLVKMFFSLHDPTTLDRQGNDIGPQYRSVIFYHDDQQKLQAEHGIQHAQEKYDYDIIVTEIAPAKTFYPAEESHQDYYSKNPNQPYCSMLIGPKIAAFDKEFDKYLI
ncbi:peptide-methionine (S)-S-oxide reductase MsrA [Pseudoalteromonas sp. SSDWG2]|uniref:peptide-methionine (S)-S-oxide reductase MsrA n=1 Tax=Pseudoalteromonas sp. SSDWG2 TaxID=3139391 RepID=UPI003BAB4188